MTIANVIGTHAHGQWGAHRHIADSSSSRHKSLAQVKPGEEVSLFIINKLADQRFVASMGDSRYIVDSVVPLTVGETVKATVSAIGGLVELKYLGSGQFEQIEPNSPDEQLGTDTPGAAALVALQSKYRMSLPQQAQKIVAAVGNDVRNPATMAIGALYLSRIGESIQPDALQALYGTQTWDEDKNQASETAVDLSALILGVQQGNTASIDALAKILGDVVELTAGTTSVGVLADGGLGSTVLMPSGGELAQSLKQDADSSSSNAQDNSLKELARHLLNQQDAGTLAYHYGSLPVIVANQLVELDLVLFRERESISRPQGMRKLVMTLRTETLGKVEVVAQSLDTNLNISIAAQSLDSTDSLSAHAQDVRELLGRLGWNIDSVSYRLSNEPMRAAEQIVKHVVSAGSLDAVV